MEKALQWAIYRTAKELNEASGENFVHESDAPFLVLGIKDPKGDQTHVVVLGAEEALHIMSAFVQTLGWKSKDAPSVLSA